MALPDSVSFVVDTCKVSQVNAQEAVEVAIADSQAAMDAVILALAYGNAKHGVHSWHHHRDCDWRFSEKMIRHLMRYNQSLTSTDVESGLHHLIHVLANAVLLYEAARMRGYVIYRGIAVPREVADNAAQDD